MIKKAVAIFSIILSAIAVIVSGLSLFVDKGPTEPSRHEETPFMNAPVYIDEPLCKGEYRRITTITIDGIERVVEVEIDGVTTIWY